jgi:hypothetical protein
MDAAIEIVSVPRPILRALTATAFLGGAVAGGVVMAGAQHLGLAEQWAQALGFILIMQVTYPLLALSAYRKARPITAYWSWLATTVAISVVLGFAHPTIARGIDALFG